VLTALAYPEIFAAIAVHSGLQYRAAGNVTEAVAAMKGGGPPPAEQARLAHAAMGARARMVPAMLIQGSRDPSVHPANLDALVVQFRALAELVGAGKGSTESGERDETQHGSYRAIRTVYRDGNGATLIESWMINGLAHAWSGGSAEGTWTDSAAPEITAEIVRFLLSHPKK
jgi:poly(3-hydroxybutyrate) depolymerase